MKNLSATLTPPEIEKRESKLSRDYLTNLVDYAGCMENISSSKNEKISFSLEGIEKIINSKTEEIKPYIDNELIRDYILIAEVYTVLNKEKFCTEGHFEDINFGDIKKVFENISPIALRSLYIYHEKTKDRDASYYVNRAINKYLNPNRESRKITDIKQSFLDLKGELITALNAFDQASRNLVKKMDELKGKDYTSEK